MEQKQIMGLPKLTSDKKDYYVWLEKFKNVLNNWHSNASLLTDWVIDVKKMPYEIMIPDADGNDVKTKISSATNSVKDYSTIAIRWLREVKFINLTEFEFQLIDSSIYSLLIDKVEGDLFFKLKDDSRRGLRAFEKLNTWFAETTVQGVMEKRKYVMSPPTAKKEEDIHISVERWDQEMTDLKRYRLNGQGEVMSEEFKKVALRQICCGDIAKWYDLHEDELDFETLKSRVMQYSYKRFKEKSHTSTKTDSGMDLSAVVAEALRNYQGQQETHEGHEHNDEQACGSDLAEQLAAVLKGKGKGKFGGKFTGTCHNCNKVGHKANECRQPPGKGGKGGGNYGPSTLKGGQRGPRTCFNCGGADHFIKDCPKPITYKSGTKGNPGKGGKGGSLHEMGTYNETQQAATPDAQAAPGGFNLGGGGGPPQGKGQDGMFYDGDGVYGVDWDQVDAINNQIDAVKHNDESFNPYGKWEKVTLIADSGAVEHVIPRSILTDMNISPTKASSSGTCFRSAKGEPIENYGEKSVKAVTDDGCPVDLTLTVANVNKGLGSIPKIMKGGNTVVFDETGSYIMHKQSCKKIPLRRERGVFAFDLWVKKAEQLGQFGVLEDDGLREVEQAFTRLAGMI
jgi:hypothetical protein